MIFASRFSVKLHLNSAFIQQAFTNLPISCHHMATIYPFLCHHMASLGHNKSSYCTDSDQITLQIYFQFHMLPLEYELLKNL